LIEDVYNLAEVEAQTRSFVIVLKHEQNLPKILCDSVQIQQVLLNLLRNGMQSMKTKGCRVGSKIIIQTDLTLAGVKVSIIDTGIGVSAELSNQLYQPFTSTKAWDYRSVSRSSLRTVANSNMPITKLLVQHLTLHYPQP
jgi:two-component system sensor kinase FixL